jgi:hypothetical protein
VKDDKKADEDTNDDDDDDDENEDFNEDDEDDEDHKEDDDDDNDDYTSDSDSYPDNNHSNDDNDAAVNNTDEKTDEDPNDDDDDDDGNYTENEHDVDDEYGSFIIGEVEQKYSKRELLKIQPRGKYKFFKHPNELVERLEKLHARLKAGNPKPNVLPKIHGIEAALVKAGIIEDESPILDSDYNVNVVPLSPPEEEKQRSLIVNGNGIINVASLSQEEPPWYKRHLKDGSYLARNTLEVINDEMKAKKALVEAMDATRNKYNKIRNRDTTYQSAREREFKPVLDAITAVKRQRYDNNDVSTCPSTLTTYKEEDYRSEFNNDYHNADVPSIPQKTNGNRAALITQQQRHRQSLPLRSKRILHSRRRFPKRHCLIRGKGILVSSLDSPIHNSNSSDYNNDRELYY